MGNLGENHSIIHNGNKTDNPGEEHPVQKDMKMSKAGKDYSTQKDMETGNNVVIYYQYCPMAFGNKGAYWFSNIEKIENPYFGEAMLNCGETRETMGFLKNERSSKNYTLFILQFSLDIFFELIEKIFYFVKEIKS